MNQTVNSRNFGQVEIIGDGNKYGYVKVRFKNTKHEDEFRLDAVLKGEIRDKYAISLCGVGIIGNIKTRGKYKQYYVLWSNMIKRCYDGSKAAYRGKVFVCERWKTFEYFYEDVWRIKGFDQISFESGMLALDKDTLQRRKKVKIYSLDTCCFVPKKTNASIQDAQQKLFVATSPDGTTYKSHNISEFGREHNLERRQISAVLHGRFKTTQGWKFKYINEEIV